LWVHNGLRRSPMCSNCSPPSRDCNITVKAGRLRDLRLSTIPPGHAFLYEEDLLGTFDPEQAAIAWDRTGAFLRARLD
jgi:hypothetical protein